MHTEMIQYSLEPSQAVDGAETSLVSDFKKGQSSFEDYTHQGEGPTTTTDL